MDFKVKIWRQKNAKAQGHFETYDVTDIESDASFIEMLDILNEKGLLMTIDENFKDKTVVMISHRNSTLGACGRVCKVLGGKIVGEE